MNIKYGINRFKIPSTLVRVTKCCNFGGFGGEEEDFDFNPTLCSCRLANPQLPILESSSIFRVQFLLNCFLIFLLITPLEPDLAGIIAQTLFI